MNLPFFTEVEVFIYVDVSGYSSHNSPIIKESVGFGVNSYNCRGSYVSSTIVSITVVGNDSSQRGLISFIKCRARPSKRF